MRFACLQRVLVDCQGIVPEVVKKAHLALSQVCFVLLTRFIWSLGTVVS